jgi:putative ATP-dependent endonuclease of the OLD family
LWLYILIRVKNAVGYSFIGIGGHGNYLTFVRMADCFEIPWFIFSDGEGEAVKSVTKALENIGQSFPDNPRVIVLEDGKDFESYIVTDKSRAQLIEAIIKHEEKGPEHKAALQRKWSKETDPNAAILEKLYDNKTYYGSVVGKILPTPPALEKLFNKIRAEFEQQPSAKAEAATV